MRATPGFETHRLSYGKRLVNQALFPDGCSCLLSRDAAEDDVAGHCIAAIAIVTVPLADHFTGSKQARNHLAVGVEHMGAGVGAQTTQRTADSRHHINGVNLALVERFGQFLTSEISVVLAFTKPA